MDPARRTSSTAQPLARRSPQRHVLKSSDSGIAEAPFRKAPLREVVSARGGVTPFPPSGASRPAFWASRRRRRDAAAGAGTCAAATPPAQVAEDRSARSAAGPRGIVGVPERGCRGGPWGFQGARRWLMTMLPPSPQDKLRFGPGAAPESRPGRTAWPWSHSSCSQPVAVRRTAWPRSRSSCSQPPASTTRPQLPPASQPPAAPRSSRLESGASPSGASPPPGASPPGAWAPPGASPAPAKCLGPGG